MGFFFSCFTESMDLASEYLLLWVILEGDAFDYELPMHGVVFGTLGFGFFVSWLLCFWVG